MTINREAIIEAVSWAIAEHEKSKRGEQSEWDQSVWICGTSCCIAGHIALKAGAVPNADLPTRVGSFVSYKGKIRVVRDLALEIIESTSPRIYDLFDENNNIEDIKRIANDLFGEEYF